MASTNPYINEHGFPKPYTAKERRRQAELDRADARRAITARPNEADPRTDFDRCTQSKYQTHRFVCDGGRTCEFCGRDLDACRIVPGTEAK